MTLEQANTLAALKELDAIFAGGEISVCAAATAARRMQRMLKEFLKYYPGIGAQISTAMKDALAAGDAEYTNKVREVLRLPPGAGGGLFRIGDEAAAGSRIMRGLRIAGKDFDIPPCREIYQTLAVMLHRFSLVWGEEEDPPLSLPKKLDTDAARKHFALALKAGYMVRTGTGFRWVAPPVHAQLGYFCCKVYKAPRPAKALAILFGENPSTLTSAISNAGLPAQQQAAQKWRVQMDRDIFKKKNKL